jgi:hypothetical protein
LKRALEPLFILYQVHAVFSGHDHTYERTKPQYGIQYFVSGGVGRVRRGVVDLTSRLRAASFDQDAHFMLIEVTDKEISYRAISKSGIVVDSGAIS